MPENKSYGERLSCIAGYTTERIHNNKIRSTFCDDEKSVHKRDWNFAMETHK